MNILFVAHEKGLNGASLSLLGIIDELIKDNKIYVLTNFKEGLFFEELKKREIKIIYGKYRWWRANKSNNTLTWVLKRIVCFLLCQINFISAFYLKDKIKQEKIDIIHSNSGVINMGAIIGKMFNIPHVWHIREFGEEDFNLYCVYSSKYTLRYMNNNSKSIITVSKAVYLKYKEFFDVNKIRVIYNGINVMNLQTKTFNNEKKELNLIICGAITQAKGQSDAILAVSELVKRGHKNINLSIAGSGHDEQVNYLKSLINKHNLNKKIKFLGRVNNLIDIRRNVDIELVCSKSEGFGRVTIEAMMSMIPVVGANTGGTKELIKDGYNGYLYEQGSHIDLADKIEIFIKDRKKVERLGGNAYRFAKEFTAERNARQIYELYQQILQK